MIVFTPIYMQRPWAGNAFTEKLKRVVSLDHVGESWEIVDRDSIQSIVSRGPEKGKTLRSLIMSDPEGMMGAGWPPEKPFPFLVKWIDCAERMSLQVHPDEIAAKKLGSEPKSEAWYVDQASPNAQVFLGLEQALTQEEFLKLLSEKTIEAYLHKIPIQKGDFLYVPSGRLHCLDKGSLIWEIQQNSDTTYRAYDWGRLGLDGEPRELHLAEVLQCANFKDVCPKKIDVASEFFSCPQFQIQKVELRRDEVFKYPSQGKFSIFLVLEGTIRTTDGEYLNYGENGLIPASKSIEISASAFSRFLIARIF